MADLSPEYREQLRRVRHAKFVVGVETEAPLAVYEKGILLENAEALATLAKKFNKKKLPAYHSAVDFAPNHRKWAITIDSSIAVGDNLKGVGSPIEIKSPALKIASENYEALFQKMWRIIGKRKVKSIEYWKMANNNIHFSLEKHDTFPLEWAKRLAFCIVYFERAIDDLIPRMTHGADRTRTGGWRHCDRYTRRNVVRPQGAETPLNDLASCWAWIRSMQSIEELFNLICYDDDDYRREQGMQTKNWKWNFKGLGYSTIEFRHMPPTRNAQETLDWITFTTSFVTAAGRVDPAKLDQAIGMTISFREALGLNEPWPLEQMLALESTWAHYGGNAGLGYYDLTQFMKEDVNFWDRMVLLRDGLEAELAELPS